MTTPTSDRTELLKRGLLLALSIVNWFALLSFTEVRLELCPKSFIVLMYEGLARHSFLVCALPYGEWEKQC